MKQYKFISVGWIRMIAIAATVFLLTSCANLESVRNFAKQSAVLTSDQEAVDYWGKWNERSKSFDAIVAKLPQKDGKTPKGPISPKSVPTKEELQAIKALQSVLSAYMSKLGSLAENDITDVSKQVDGLVENLNKLPSDMPEEKQKKVNAAYGALIKLVKLPLEAYRHYKVRELIRENDNNIQLLTEGLSVAMGSVAKFSKQEKNSVLNWYEIITIEYPAPPNFSSAYQWGKDRSSIIEKYEDKSSGIVAYQKALQTIGNSHHKMANDIGVFNTESFKRLASSLKDARDQIVSARDQYRKAFE